MYQILVGGCNTWHPNTFVMNRPNGVSNYVLLIIKTHCHFVLNETVYDIRPGTAIIIDHHTPYSYFNPNGDYMDDWLHFKPDSYENFLQCGICPNIFFPLPGVNRFTTYIQQLLYENEYTPAPFKMNNIDHLMSVLINNLVLAFGARDTFSQTNMYEEQLKELRLIIQHAPKKEYTIKKCADQIGISTSHFQHLYTNLFGISFQRDLIRMKVDYSANLLLVTNQSIEQIAEQSGYTNTVHFYRQFKEIYGMTPSTFRRTNHSDNVK